MRREYSGNAKATTLSGAVSAAATSIAVADATGYPTGATGPFVVTIDTGLASEEKVLCLSRTGNTLTVSSRGWDDTTAADHANAATVQHTYSATDADEANEHVNQTTGTPHGTAYATPAESILKSIIDAKGDLIVGTAADTVTRLAPGTNTHVLTADSSQATGIKWAAIPTTTNIVSGSYVGDGTGSRTIALAFTPKLILISSDANTDFFVSGLSTGAADGFGVRFAAAAVSVGQTLGIRPLPTTNGFLVGTDGASSNNTNISGDTYFYVALG